MDDELESLLREHYRRSAQNINPDPGLAARLRTTTRRRRRPQWLSGRLMLAAAVTAIALAGGLTWVTVATRGDRAEPAAVQGAPPTIRISSPILYPGGLQRVTGNVTPAVPLSLTVQANMGGHWVTETTSATTGGSFKIPVTIPADATAIRLCTTTVPITCSPSFPLLGETPLPNPTPRSPHTSRSPFTPLSPSRRPGAPGPTMGTANPIQQHPGARSPSPRIT